MNTAPELLKLEKINKSFPGVKALADVNLTVNKGEILALVGENGAGKSTLMKILSGAYNLDSGKIFMNGKQVEITSPKQSEQLGISIIYQELNLIKRDTIAENVYLGRYPKKFGIIQWKKMYRDAQMLFDTFNISLNAKSVLSNLSIAKQQLVEIIKAVSIKAKIVIMDEPTSSLSKQETETLFNIIRKLKAQGVSVIFITHRMDEIFEICDRVAVLRDGCYIGSRYISDTNKSEIIAMMIGRELIQQYPIHNTQVGEEMLCVEHLSNAQKNVSDVSFTAYAGEVVGFAGLVGAGRTETMRLIFGADKSSGGKIKIRGQEVSIKSPIDAIAHGIGFVTENRKEEGLLLKHSVQNNSVLVAFRRFLKFHFCIDFRKEQKCSSEYIKKLNIMTPSPKQKCLYLSGGNQQKVVLAKWLMNDPKIIIFDEPTRGIDVGAKREIYELIKNLAENGHLIIAVCSDLEEVMGISDRIIVMHEGKISAVIEKRDFNQQLIMEYAIGEKSCVYSSPCAL